MKIIIGASGGIGSKLFYHYIPLEAVIGTFFTNGEDSEYMWTLNVADYKDVEYFANEIDLYDEKICLINCSGINYDAMAHKANPIDWADVIDTNLVGAFYVIEAFLPFMREKKYGRIINMGSVVAQKGVAGTSAYAASKAGLWGMTKAIAAENKDNGVTINTLNLGYMDAGMASDMDVTKGDIQNVINAIDFLVASPFVTGAAIDINGGLI
jgi:NAD(P)-dependent dehydrogenase (short-subunit alcohol dehydrogenase family)